MFSNKKNDLTIGFQIEIVFLNGEKKIWEPYFKHLRQNFPRKVYRCLKGLDPDFDLKEAIDLVISDASKGKRKISSLSVLKLQLNGRDKGVIENLKWWENE